MGSLPAPHAPSRLSPACQVHVFPSRDGNLSINVLGYEDGDGHGLSPAEGTLPSAPPTRGAGRASGAAAKDGGSGDGGNETVIQRALRPSGELLEYAASLQAGEWLGDPMHPPPGPMVGWLVSAGVGRCRPVSRDFRRLGRDHGSV